MAERVARNQSIFREANERIERAAEGVVDDPPFVCECSDPGCTAVVRLTLAQYEEVRRDGRLFFNVPGHERASGRWGEVVERHDRYVVVEKVGDAGRLAEQEAPSRVQETP